MFFNSSTVVGFPNALFFFLAGSGLGSARATGGTDVGLADKSREHTVSIRVDTTIQKTVSSHSVGVSGTVLEACSSVPACFWRIHAGRLLTPRPRPRPAAAGVGEHALFAAACRSSARRWRCGEKAFKRARETFRGTNDAPGVLAPRGAFVARVADAPLCVSLGALRIAPCSRWAALDRLEVDRGMVIDHAFRIARARARATLVVANVHKSVIDCSSPHATWPLSLIGAKAVGTGALAAASAMGLFDAFWTPGRRDTSEAGSSCVAAGTVGLAGAGSSGLEGAASPELGAGHPP